MKYTLILGLMLSAVITFAQKDDDAMKKIEAARIALITERLNLTPEQAEKFWPVYREYTQQRQQLRDEFHELRKSESKEMTNDESKKILQRGMQLKERQLSLDKTYNERLSSVITTNQILQLRRAEDDFRQMIIKRLEKRKDERERINRKLERKQNDQ
jgi:hypothetical protein